MNPRVIAQVFLGMFVVAGFSHETIAQSRCESTRNERDGRRIGGYILERSFGKKIVDRDKMGVAKFGRSHLK